MTENSRKRPAFERMKWIARALLSRRVVTLEVIAREFEVAPRTAARDIEFMRDRLGHEIEFDHQSRTWRYLRPPEGLL